MKLIGFYLKSGTMGIAIYKDKGKYYYAKQYNYKIQEFKEIPREKYFSMKENIIPVECEIVFNKKSKAFFCFVENFKNKKIFYGDIDFIRNNLTDYFLSLEEFENKEDLVKFAEQFVYATA